MSITARINTNIPNRYLRRLKYKIYQLSEKFNFLISTQLYIDEEGSRNKEYSLKLIFSVPGPDLIIRSKGASLDQLIEKNLKNAHRLLANYRK